jgi:2-keto-4-pentenoate hydratase
MPEETAAKPLDLTRIAELAKHLEVAECTRTPCEPLTVTEPGLTVEDAYRIQELNKDRRGGWNWHRPPRIWAAGVAGFLPQSADSLPEEEQVGWKVGLTSAEVQRQLGIDQPDFGYLTHTMAVPDGGIADFGRLLQPRVEGEIAFMLESDLNGPHITAAHVLAATEFVVAAVEIADCRIKDWNIKVADTVADNAAAAMYALGGKPLKPTDLDMRLAGMALRINGEVAATGVGAACLGHPANAVAWLARKLSALNSCLEAGQLVLSGAMCPLVTVLPGDHVEVEISRLGRVAVQFSREEA